MPMIQLTVPAAAIPSERRDNVQQALAEVLLRWEGTPDTAFFRSLVWSYFIELPEGAHTTAADPAPRFRVEVTVPQGVLSDRRKAGLVDEVTAVVLDAADLTEDDARLVWVLIHEQPDGTWGVGGSIIRRADLLTLARECQTDA